MSRSTVGGVLDVEGAEGGGDAGLLADRGPRGALAGDGDGFTRGWSQVDDVEACRRALRHIDVRTDLRRIARRRDSHGVATHRKALHREGAACVGGHVHAGAGGFAGDLHLGASNRGAAIADNLRVNAAEDRLCVSDIGLRQHQGRRSAQHQKLRKAIGHEKTPVMFTTRRRQRIANERLLKTPPRRRSSARSAFAIAAICHSKLLAVNLWDSVFRIVTPSVCILTRCATRKHLRHFCAVSASFRGT